MFKIKEDKLALIFLKISHSLFLIFSLMGHIEIFRTPLKIGTYIAIAILIINFFLQYRTCTKRELGVYVFLLFIALIHSYFSENYLVIKLMMFYGSLKKVELRTIVKFDAYLRVFLIVLVSLLSIVGIAPDVVYSYNGIIRHSMGFTNPNALGIAVFVLACDILYISNLKLTLKNCVAFSVLFIWLYQVARCRSAAYVMAALMLIVIIYNIKRELFTGRIGKMVFYSVPFVLIILTIIVVNGYLNYEEFAYRINDFLSGRVKSIVNFVRVLSPTLFGQPIHETLDKTLDNTFAFVWYDLGIVVSVIFIFAYLRLIKLNYKNNTGLCIIMMGFMVYGLSEHLWINVDYNVFMLAFCANYGYEKTSHQSYNKHLRNKRDGGFQIESSQNAKL